jgi:hypothetical protein
MTGINCNLSSQSNGEEIIGGEGVSITIGEHYASSKTVRLRSGATIGKIIFPTPLGHGTVILEGTATVGTIVNGERATASSQAS